MEGMIGIRSFGDASCDRSGCGSITRGRVSDSGNAAVGPQANFGVRCTQAECASLRVGRESNVSPVLSEEGAKCSVRALLFVVVGFGRGERGARVALALGGFGRRP
eukprot:3312329-Pleurochrysis_carterae.AAC.1